MRAKLIDISRFQQKIDGKAIKAAGFCGIVARCTVGWSYRDAWYVNNMIEAHENDLIFGAYHVLWPENQAPGREAAWFADNFSPTGADRPPDLIVADIELMHNLSARNVANQVVSLLQHMQSETGKKPKIYTASWFWDETGNLGPATPIGIEQEYDLWEAEYLRKPLGRTFRPDESPEEPKRPNNLSDGWIDWWAWQWTSSGQPIGVQSDRLDYDVYKGTEEELKAELGMVPALPTLTEKVDTLWDAHPELHSEV